MIGYVILLILFIITINIFVKKVCYALLKADKMKRIQNLSRFNKGGNV